MNHFKARRRRRFCGYCYRWIRTTFNEYDRHVEAHRVQARA